MRKMNHQVKVIILLLVVAITVFGTLEVYADPAGGSFDVPQISEDFTNFIVYDREKAVQYAKKWSDEQSPGKLHPEFERMDSFGTKRGGDCANFVSQLLHAGGLKMNDDWYYEKGIFIRHIPILNRLIKYFSPKWAVADEQYRYFSDKNNGYSEKTFEASSVDDLKELKKMGEIKPGDLLYWDFEGDGRINHATMITNVDSEGHLLYSGHTYDQYNANVTESFKHALRKNKNKTRLHIVKMKDQIEVK